MSEERAVGDIAKMTSAELLPLVYGELRRLAAARLAREAEPMQPTSLVHAAYLRVVGDAAREERAWDGAGHFFAAAALAMRRILVERGRQRRQGKRGAGWGRVELETLAADDAEGGVDIESLDSALGELERFDAELYRVAMLRYFGGATVEDAAAALGVSPVTVKRRWTVARLWLLERIEDGESGEKGGA